MTNQKIFFSFVTSLLMLVATQPAFADWNTNISKNNQVTPTDVEFYDQSLLTTSDGYTYCYFILSGDHMQYRVQIMDPNGNRVCKTAGLTVSKEASNTWTKVNYPTVLDNEGNLIMAVQDMRTRNDELGQYYLYSLYKINRKGEILWAHSLNDSIASFDCSHITLSVAPDNSIYAAFGEAGKEYSSRYLHIEKLDENGKSLWDNPLLIKDGNVDDGNYQYPTIKALTDNSAMVGFLDGSSYHYQMTRINADGTLAWDTPKDIYTGSYGSDKVWSCINMRQLNDSTFAFVTLDGSKMTVVTCFDKDGNNLIFGDESHAISNFTEDENGLTYGLSLDDFCYDSKDNVLNLVYRQIDLSSSYHHGIYVQQMGIDGSWYFEDEGHPIIEVQNDDQYAYSQIRQTDKDGELAVFYIKKETHSYTAPAQCYMCKLNYDTDITLEPVAFTGSNTSKSELCVSDLIDGKYYLASWLEKRGSATQPSIYMQRVYVDGDVVDGIKDVTTESQRGDNAIYDLMGRRVNGTPKGLYIQNGRTLYNK